MHNDLVCVCMYVCRLNRPFPYLSKIPSLSRSLHFWQCIITHEECWGCFEHGPHEPWDGGEHPFKWDPMCNSQLKWI